MAFTRFDKDVEVISKLSDDPNITDALSSNQLKAKFDQGAATIKKWINDALFVALEDISAATNIGAKLSGYSDVTTVQAALEKLKGLIRQYDDRILTDGSVTTNVLASADPLHDPPIPAAVATDKIQDGAVTHAKLATIDANGENGAVDTDNICNGAITSAKLAQQAISGSAITNNSIEGNKLKANIVTTDKLAVYDDSDPENVIQPAVSAENIQDGAVSALLTGTLTSTGWAESSGQYTQSIFLTGILAGDAPIADVQYSGDYETDSARVEAFAKIYRIETNTGSITAYALEQPTVALPIRLLCIRK